MTDLHVNNIVKTGLMTCATAASIACIFMAAPASGRCPGGITCTYGKVIIQDPGSDTVKPDPNQLLVEDKNRAPMFWVNAGGAYSGGTPFCVTDLRVRDTICLGGTNGNPVITFREGSTQVTLTAQDVQFLHQLEKGGPGRG